MSLTTHEPLQQLRFDSRESLAEFLTRVFEAVVGPSKRDSPAGPLVIYGWLAQAPKAQLALYVTAGILRMAERLAIPTPTPSGQIPSADQLPEGTELLYASLGYKHGPGPG